MSKNKHGKFSIDEKIENTKFDFAKNLKWFIIAPIAIIIVGIIMLCTLGFNLGIDFTGGSVMTIYIDSEGEYTQYSETTYDLDEDFSEIRSIISDILKEYGLSIDTIQKTTITDNDIGIYEGDAVVVKYQNDSSLTTEEMEEINQEIKLQLLKTFGYVDADATLDDLDEVTESALVINGGVTSASEGSEVFMRAMIALVVAILIIFLYISLRFDLTSGFASLLTFFHDILMVIAVMSICRVEISSYFLVALFVTMIISFNNTITIFDRIRTNVKTARLTSNKLDNVKIVNNSVKNILPTLIFAFGALFILVLIALVTGTSKVYEFMFAILVGVIASAYSSVFIAPALWAVAYKPSKKVKTSKPKTEKDKVVEVKTVEREENAQ